MVVALGRRCVLNNHHHHGVTVVYGFAPIITITTSPPHIHTRQPRALTWSRTVSTITTKRIATTSTTTQPQHNPTLHQWRNLKRVGTALSTVSQCWKTFSWRRLSKRIRHRAVVFVTSFLLIWNMANVGSLSSSSSVPSLLFTPPVAHAASTTTTAAKMERVFDRISQSDVDQIIHHYVQQHMFDDDMSVTDPVVGTYREAYTDHMTPKYPMSLRQIITDAFRGSTTTTSSSTSNVSKRPPLDVGLVLTQTIQLLQRTLGCTEMTATIVLSIAFVVAGPSAFLLFGMIVGGISKRNMDQVFKKRYGETYTVDATIKKEPVVELPSDDDEEDDDDDDNDEDDDEEEDDSKTKGKNKDKKK